MRFTANNDATLSPELSPAALRSEFFTVTIPGISDMAGGSDSADIFCDGAMSAVQPRNVPGYPGMTYIPFGPDDHLPHDLIRTIGSDLVLSQNQLFNILTLYGSGLQYMDIKTKEETADPEISRFALSNSLTEFFLEQATDLKYFFFTVAVIILSKDGSKIVRIRHKDACNCRFEKADENGYIKHVFVANWDKNGLTRNDIEVIPLLDRYDPLGDLERLMGRAPGLDGKNARLSAPESSPC